MRTRFQLATFGFYFGIAGATAVLWAFPKLGPSTYWTLDFYRYFSALGFWAENYWYAGCFAGPDPIAEKLFLILGARNPMVFDCTHLRQRPALLH